MKNKKLLSHINMSKKILTFGDVETEKNKFHRHKTSIFLEDVDVDIKKLLVSNNITSGEKTTNNLFVTRIITQKLSHYI